MLIFYARKWQLGQKRKSWQNVIRLLSTKVTFRTVWTLTEIGYISAASARLAIATVCNSL
jgi:hypothetical protein